MMRIFNFFRLYRESSTQSGQFSIFNERRGIASLPAILLLGGIIIEIAIAGAFLLFYLNNSIYGSRLANEALMLAQAGIQDGVMRVILDKSLSTNYDLALAEGSTEVDICTNCGPGGKHQITSTGTVLTRQHELRAILAVDQTTGDVLIDSITEVTQ